jgi:hypothetical protein
MRLLDRVISGGESTGEGSEMVGFCSFPFNDAASSRGLKFHSLGMVDCGTNLRLETTVFCNGKYARR